MTRTALDPRAALLGVYQPPDPLFVRGSGAELFDAAGRAYLDFTSGIGVTALGHDAPEVRAAIEAALRTGLVHTSNLFRTSPGEELAALLADRCGLDRVFFCNSGAEAVEGALKFARKSARERGGAARHRFVALRGSFHGRLFGSLATTDRAGFREPFEPLMPGVDFVDPEDGSALDAALDPERTAALLVEPVQGEGGIRVIPDEALARMRELTERRGILLILDEIQCGLGRTGTFCAYEPAGIRPDLLVLAKPLAGGLPMGAVLMTEQVASALRPGDHGSTFGGGPLVASVARAVVERISEPAFLAAVRSRGERLGELLGTLAATRPDRVLGVRGRGLMRGLELDGEAAPVVERAFAAGLLLARAGPDVVRLLPPLTVTDEELARGVAILTASLG